MHPAATSDPFRCAWPSHRDAALASSASRRRSIASGPGAPIPSAITSSRGRAAARGCAGKVRPCFSTIRSDPGVSTRQSNIFAGPDPATASAASNASSTSPSAAAPVVFSTRMSIAVIGRNYNFIVDSANGFAAAQ